MKTRRTILAVMGFACLVLSLLYFTGGLNWITRAALRFSLNRRAMQLAEEHVRLKYKADAPWVVSWPIHTHNAILIKVTTNPHPPGGDLLILLDKDARHVLESRAGL